MAKQFARIEPAHRNFIERQRVFFTASAAPQGHVNVSPKGLDALRVLGPHAVAYLDLTGSGNETAAHLLADGRLTIMFCAFEGPPMILRLYGRGQVLRRGSGDYVAVLAGHFGASLSAPGISCASMSTSFRRPAGSACLFDYEGERPSLGHWAETQGEAGLEAYRREKNMRSIDGLPTGLLAEGELVEGETAENVAAAVPRSRQATLDSRS